MKKILSSLLFLPLAVSAEVSDDPLFQLENSPPPFYPISISGSYVDVSKAHFRTSEFQHDTVKYRQGEVAVALTYPFNDVCGLIFGAGWIGTEVNMENNPEFHETFFNYINGSLGAFTNAFPDWTWSATFSVYLDTAEFSFIDYALYDGVLWGRFDCCDSFELDFGFIVEAGLHKEKVWPILGFVWLPWECLRISAVYPVDISIEYSFLSYWSAGGSIRFLRNRHRVKPCEPNPQGIFEYRTAGAEFDLNFTPFDWFAVSGFAGSTFNGDFKVTNRNDNDPTHFKFKGSFYAGASAILSF